MIASVDFDERTVSGATASNLTWNLNGVANPGDLTASHSLFNTADAQDLFAVNRNVGTEGEARLDVPLNVLDSDIELDNVTLNAFIFNNNGDEQPLSRELDLTLELRAEPSFIESVFVNNVYRTTNSAPTQPTFVTFVFAQPTLAANTSYTLRLRATNNSGIGTNLGMDDLTINGTLLSPPGGGGGGGNPFGPGGVPEPTRAVLLMLGAVAVSLRRRR